MLLTILGIAGAVAGLGALIFGAAGNHRTANALQDIHNTIKKTQ